MRLDPFDQHQHRRSHGLPELCELIIDTRRDRREHRPGDETIALVSRLCRESIAWARDHREEVMTALLAEETRDEVGLDRALLDRYLTMYANHDTLDFAPDARAAVDELFARGVTAGLLPEGAHAAFAP